MKFYVCKHCGNIIHFEKNTGVPVICCGEKMQELIAGTVEASQEKHIPVISSQENKVTVEVGSILHPMAEAHHISWIFLETTQGYQKKELTVGHDAIAEFMLCDGDKVISAYAYCNLHGLWKS